MPISYHRVVFRIKWVNICKGLIQCIAHKNLQLSLKSFNQESHVIRFVLQEIPCSCMKGNQPSEGRGWKQRAPE